MKKTILILFLTLVAFVKTSIGQYGSSSDISITFLDFRYEYHPTILDIEQKDFSFQNIHAFKFGMVNLCFFVGEYNDMSLEWRVVNLMASTSKLEPWGAGFTSFSLRKDMGRFNPSVSLDFAEFTHNVVLNTTVFHHSISGGFEFYFTNRSLLTCNIGLRYEMPWGDFGSGRLSPFVGVGYKFDALIIN